MSLANLTQLASAFAENTASPAPDGVPADTRELTDEQIEREFLKWGAEPADAAWRVASRVERTRRTFHEAFRIAERLTKEKAK